MQLSKPHQVQGGLKMISKSKLILWGGSPGTIIHRIQSGKEPSWKWVILKNELKTAKTCLQKSRLWGHVL